MREDHEGILKRVNCRFVWPAGPFRRPSRPRAIPRSPSDRLLCHWMRHRWSPLERVPARQIRCVPRYLACCRQSRSYRWRRSRRSWPGETRHVRSNPASAESSETGMDAGRGRWEISAQVRQRLRRRSMTTPLSLHVFQRRSADPRGLKNRGPYDLTCPDQRSRFRRRSTKPPTKLHEDGVRASWP